MTYDVCVIGGCGHVGLPLSIAFAIRGKRVAIYDIDREASRQVSRGEMPFMEEDGERMLREALASGRLTIGADPHVVSNSDALVLVVGTPIDSHLTPSFEAIDDILRSFKPYLRDGQLIILRSTLYPGTSARIERWLSTHGFKIDLAVCPERIMQGRGLSELFGLPQIVSAFSAAGLARSRKLFSSLSKEIVEMQPLEAELAKLFTNAWRYIKFAVANQYYMIATELGVDYDVIYHGITHNYPRSADFPPPGFAAGPCLFKDTMQLASFTQNSFFLGHAAMLVNEGLPQFIVNSLRKSEPDLAFKVVGILGMAFKAEVDDERDSLSHKLRSLLEIEAGGVLCADPYVRRPGLLPADTVIDRSDIVIVATPHKAYKNLDFGDKRVIDIWNLRGQGRRL
ncbi:MAG: nucleotide sugar dehydrogenase [Candidatus Binatus sp.]|uniref:nucleotide sugar dehydrogenase n=1 Tax=Candidatus Binatus sp. TaxID=2811406 RepID=UPI002720CBAB|nr:nucleotide sugar dehydrogenase [Candidatus Binatus sp.]MDO8432179.1 nucleotide sugar dehydrogenase [Candidatus Binatus sp.]